MSMMLASVSDVAEARLALDSAVDWLDIKDPRAGALGRPAASVVRDIVALPGRGVPVSATLGDGWYAADLIPARVEAMHACGVDYVKLALMARDIDQPTLTILSRCAARGRALIVVCMAERPPQACDIDALAGAGIAGVMLDTANKAGARLTELIDESSLRDFVQRARGHGLLTGLAGRLQLGDVPLLLSTGADYLGFRSALCDGGDRKSSLSRAAIVQVRAAVHGATAHAQKHQHSGVA